MYWTRRIVIIVLSLLSLLVIKVLCDEPISIDKRHIQSTAPLRLRLLYTLKRYRLPDCAGDLMPDLPSAERLLLSAGPTDNANRYISSRISGSYGRNTLNISIATKLYDDYCTINGYTQQAPVTTTSGIGALTITITAAATTVERTITVTRGSTHVESSGNGCRFCWATGWASFAPLLIVILAAMCGGLAFAD